MEYCENLACYALKPCDVHTTEAVRRVVVLGSTGHQGGSVLNVLANSKMHKYQLVAVTRDTNSKPAQALKRQIPGLELIVADADDKQSLVKAFRNAWAVFGFTISDYTADNHEFNQGKNIADAADEAKVQVMLWSSAPYANHISHGTIKVPGFDTKAEIELYMRKKSFKTIALIATSFFENLLTILAPRADPSDPSKFIISNPCKPETAIQYFSASDDPGKFVEYALENVEKSAGTTVVMAGDYLSGNDLARRVGQFFNKTVEFKQLEEEVFRSYMPDPKVADALLAMSKYFDGFGYGCGSAEVVDAKRGSNLEDWLSRNKHEFAFDELQKLVFFKETTPKFSTSQK